MSPIIVKGDRNRVSVELTLNQLANIYRSQEVPVLEQNLPFIQYVMRHFRIDENKYEVAAFLAQIGHESAELKYRKENLNYSATALRRVFGKYFKTAAQANAYARNPEKIANRVYANRIGNGPESSGDGWKFRGRGYIQLTGRANYQDFADYMMLSLDDTINYLETLEGAWMCAGWYWETRGLDRFDDSPSMFKKLTKLINGGYNGLQHRTELYNRALKYL